MASVETSSEGLRRTYKVVIPAAELVAALDAKIKETAPKLSLKGFRPGKAPMSHVRKMYGPAMMQELINEKIDQTTKDQIGEARIAAQPQLEMTSDINGVMAGQADLAFQVQLEVMPEFEPMDAAEIAIEKPVAPVEESQVEKTLAEIAASNRLMEETEEPAQDGDALTIDFVGKLDGVAFDGGTAEGVTLTLGSKQFIPGFEEELTGVKAGEDKTFEITFPEDYPAENLKGKLATFEVSVKGVRRPQEAAPDDALAERLGFENLEALTKLVRDRLEQDHNALSRAKAKRKLFDVLDAGHSFELPAGMVSAEFAQIWRQIEADKQAERLDADDAAKSEEELRAEYKKIAERRVRLGLVLAEIGQRNKVEIRNEEVVNAIRDQARRFPGQEREVIDFYMKNENALAQLRAPIYEDKVVDFILELAKITPVTVTREALLEDDPPG